MACSSFVFLPFQRDVTRLPYDTENYIEGETFSSRADNRDMAENINPKIIMVILNPSHVILSVAKNLFVQLRTGSMKDLVIEYKSKILRPEQVAGLKRQQSSDCLPV
jgi:hypothetical protein